VSVSSVGYLVTGYGVTVALASLPLAHLTRAVPRRHVWSTLWFVVFGVACLAGVTLTGALLDRFPHSALTAAVVTQTAGMLGLYAAGDNPVAAVVFLVLVGGALGPVFMATQNEMLHFAPGRTDIALAANSGAYKAGIAAGATLGGLVLPHVDVRGAFLVGGLLTTGAGAVLLGERLLPARRS
jgi:predicted MFS family arabinose efflux permease